MRKKAYLLICSCAYLTSSVFATPPDCQPINENEVSALFDEWNNALQSQDPHKVVDLYSDDAVLLPTLSNKIRLTQEERIDYFRHFLARKPVGKIDFSVIKIGCNKVANTGHYTFYFENRDPLSARYSFTYVWENNHWMIDAHHSSLLPPQ